MGIVSMAKHKQEIPDLSTEQPPYGYEQGSLLMQTVDLERLAVVGVMSSVRPGDMDCMVMPSHYLTDDELDSAVSVAQCVNAEGNVVLPHTPEDFINLLAS